MEVNPFGQPVGDIIPNWQVPPFPPRQVIEGRDCRLEPLQPSVHTAPLWEAFSKDSGAMWTYFGHGPYEHYEDFAAAIAQWAVLEDPQYYAIIDAPSGKALGLASYLRIDPQSGSIEVGWLHFSPAMQRTRLSTAAMALMMQNAFKLGYRRYEWKCNALNAPSFRAAERLGFTFEGIFRQATVSKGRSRDTAWFSVIDSEWPALQMMFNSWLSADNFDEKGQQIRALSECRETNK